MSLQLTKKGEIDWGTVGRLGLGGAAFGGGLAALVSLLHSVNLARRRAKDESADSSEIDENTIVLRVPEKKAEDLTKCADWPTAAAGAMAAVLGTGAMYAIINKLYHKQVMKGLAAEEEAARTQLMGGIASQDKRAFVDSLFDEELTKVADTSYIDAPIALAVLLTVLGAGSTAYSTKKILDSKLKAVENKDYAPPKVHRVVLQSVPDASKQASADDMMCLRAALAVSIDAQLPEAIYAKQAEAELAKLNATPADLVKLASSKDGLFSFMCDYPQVARPIDAYAMRELSGPMRTARLAGLDKDAGVMGELGGTAVDVAKEPLLIGEKLVQGDLAGVASQHQQFRKSMLHRLLRMLGIESDDVSRGSGSTPVDSAEPVPASLTPDEKTAADVGKAVLGGIMGAAGLESASDTVGETVSDALAESLESDESSPLPREEVNDPQVAAEAADGVEVEAPDAESKAILTQAILKAIKSGTMKA